jgi:hypothetical protein
LIYSAVLFGCGEKSVVNGRDLWKLLNYVCGVREHPFTFTLGGFECWLSTRSLGRERYRARITLKLDLHSTAALVRYAVRNKIFEA